MAAIGILQIHENITSSSGHYCSVCFRTVSERRLVEPFHLKRFISNIKTILPFRAQIKVCYICESLAASAAKFCEAVQLASRVAALCEDITSSGQWQQVVKCVKENKRKAPSNEPLFLRNKPVTHVLRRAVTMELLLQDSPRYELSRTETLVVAKGPPLEPESDDVVIIDNEDPLPCPPAPPLLPDPPPLPAPSPLPEMLMLLPAPRPSTRLSINMSMLPDKTGVQVVNINSKEVVLHPIVKGFDGKMYVPSLQLQVNDNDVFKSVPDTVFLNNVPSLIAVDSLPNTQASPQKSTKNTIIEPRLNQNKEITTVKTDKRPNYYNFIQTQAHEKQNFANNVDITKGVNKNILNDGTKRKMNALIDSQNQVQHLLSDNTKGSCEINIIDDDSNPASDGLTESKQPVLKTDRTVDWEDKIPMDVISFMDATDPNPAERIMQPRRPAGMGFISDVRSLPRRKRARRGECVHLC